VIVLFMALPFFVESAPRAYWLKAGNADPPISTSGGTSPSCALRVLETHAAPTRRRTSNMAVAAWRKASAETIEASKSPSFAG